jgi:CheY-like chemotaxis protein
MTAPPAKQPRILVVDDERSILTLVRMALTTEGYEVVTADSGPAAVDLAEAAAPDLALVDLIMPGMDGGEVIRTLRSRGLPSVPCIIMTAANNPEVVTAPIEPSAVLRKPFDLLDLLELVGKHLSLAQSAAAANDNTTK